MEQIHPDLILKAQELCLHNHTSAEIKESLRNHVVNELFWRQDLPDMKRRRYNPNKKDIYNIIARTRFACKFTEGKQDDIKKLIEQIRERNKNVRVYFNVEANVYNGNKAESSDEEFFVPDDNPEAKKKRGKEIRKIQTFLFAYQTAQQQRLLKRYGYVAYIVQIECDNLNKTLPFEMYALLVQTNIDFQVVGLFCASKQMQDGVKRGLSTLREWNTDWEPKYLLVDCCEKIYGAISAVFPGKQLVFPFYPMLYLF